MSRAGFPLINNVSGVLENSKATLASASVVILIRMSASGVPTGDGLLMRSARGRASEYGTWDREFDDSRQKHPKACLDGAGLLDDDQLRSLIGGVGGLSWIHLAELEVERDCRDQELGSLGLAIA